MPVTITVRDETSAGESYNEMRLEMPSERITVRELIRERVYQEVQDFNQRQHEKVFRGLVQPTDTECVLNGRPNQYQLKTHRQIEWQPQFEKALDAFTKNGFFILVDDKQAESLEQMFIVHPRTEISFIKLTMLVGG